MHSTNSANTDRNRKGHGTFMIVQSNPILILLLKGASSEECQVLHLLWRALPGHHLQHHDAEEDAVLHSQPDHPLHGHLLPHSPRVLSPLWQRGEGIISINTLHISTWHIYVPLRWNSTLLQRMLKIASRLVFYKDSLLLSPFVALFERELVGA